MKTRFYTGNYSLGLGQPYVIISVEETEAYYRAEKIILFEGFNGQPTTIVYNVKCPNHLANSLNDFISSEIQVCKDDIFYNILFRKYKDQLERKNYNVNIELLPANANIISLLQNKFPHILDKIKEATINKELETLVGLYQSIKIERDDFEIA